MPKHYSCSVLLKIDKYLFAKNSLVSFCYVDTKFSLVLVAIWFHLNANVSNLEEELQNRIEPTIRDFIDCMEFGVLASTRSCLSVHTILYLIASHASDTTSTSDTLGMSMNMKGHKH